MTIQEAYNFFESLKIETAKKSEIKIYDNFIHILSELKTREFSKEEINSIETELDDMNLESYTKNKKKYFTKVLSKFEKYLKDTLSLTLKDHYTKLYTQIGGSFGIFFGLVALSNFERSMGLIIGMFIGAAIGAAMGKSLDSNALKEDRVL